MWGLLGRTARLRSRLSCTPDRDRGLPSCGCAGRAAWAVVALLGGLLAAAGTASAQTFVVAPNASNVAGQLPPGAGTGPGSDAPTDRPGFDPDDVFVPNLDPGRPDRPLEGFEDLPLSFGSGDGAQVNTSGSPQIAVLGLWPGGRLPLSTARFDLTLRVRPQARLVGLRLLDPAGDDRIRDLLDQLGPDGTVTVERDSPPPGGQRTLLVEANDAQGRLRRVRILLWHVPPLPEVPPPQVAELPSGSSEPEPGPADGESGAGGASDGDSATVEGGSLEDAAGDGDAAETAGEPGQETEREEAEPAEPAAWRAPWLWALAALLPALALLVLARRLRRRDRLPPAGVPVRLVAHPDWAGQVLAPAGPRIAVSFRIDRGGPARVAAGPDPDPDRAPPATWRAGE